MLLRRAFMKRALPGPVYVPFIGDGDLAVELYADRPIYGADLDPLRVETAAGRLTGSDVRVFDCNDWPFPELVPFGGTRAEDQGDGYAAADFDAFVNPYQSLDAFWTNARKAPRIMVFGTDGLKHSMAISGMRYTRELPSGQTVPADMATVRHDFNFWWVKLVLPWLKARVAPSRVVTTQMYQRSNMIYWGIEVQK